MKFRTPAQCTHVASIGLVAGSILMLAGMASGAMPFLLYEMVMMFLLACKGLCFTSTVAMAMNEEHNNAGTVSSLIGAVIFLFGGIVSPLVGIGSITLSSSLIFVVCAFLALHFDLLSRRPSAA